jgi:surface polysaccharide O-acyltransferase-like enzyme
MVLVCPFIKYIELRGGRDLRPAGFRLVAPITEGFLDFLPRFFGRVASATWSHLWFLAYLLVISALLLPLLRKAARTSVSNRRPQPWIVYLMGLGLALCVAALNGYWPYYPNLYRDWNNLAYYGTCFALGAWLAIWPGLEGVFRHQWPGLLLAAVLGFLGVAA